MFDDTEGPVREFFEKEGGDWPIVTDPNGSIATSLGMSQVPETWIISDTGIVTARFIGEITADGLTTTLADLRRQSGGGLMSSDLNRRLKGWPGWVAMIVVVVALMAVGMSRDSGPQNQRGAHRRDLQASGLPDVRRRERVRVRASSSENLRNEIARLVAEAELTDDQIVQQIDGNYTQDLTLTPDASGLEGLAWILPVVVAVLAVGGLAFAFRHWRSVIDRRASEEDRELVAAAIAASHAGDAAADTRADDDTQVADAPGAGTP